MALALFFAGVTARVLLDDVWAWSPALLDRLTVSHIAAITGIVAAIAAGHFALPSLRQGSIAYGLLLVLVFIGATGYVVVSSGMRNAETQASKVAGAAKSREERAAALAAWQRLDAELQTVAGARSTQSVRAAMDAIVGSADGQVPVAVFRRSMQCTDITKPESAQACGPLLKLRVEMAAAIRKHELEPQVAEARKYLDGLKAPAATGGYAHAAKVIAALPFVTATAAAIEERLELVMPFVGVVIGEAATIAFFGLALGHRQSLPATSKRRPAAKVAGKRRRQSLPAKVAAEPAQQLPANVVTLHAGNGARPTSAKVVGKLGGSSDIVAALQAAGRSMTVSELGRAMGVSTGEASRRWREAGTLVVAQRIGRELHVSLAVRAVG